MVGSGGRWWIKEPEHKNLSMARPHDRNKRQTDTQREQRQKRWSLGWGELKIFEEYSLFPSVASLADAVKVT